MVNGWVAGVQPTSLPHFFFKSKTTYLQVEIQLPTPGHTKPYNRQNNTQRSLRKLNFLLFSENVSK